MRSKFISKQRMMEFQQAQRSRQLLDMARTTRLGRAQAAVQTFGKMQAAMIARLQASAQAKIAAAQSLNPTASLPAPVQPPPVQIVDSVNNGAPTTPVETTPSAEVAQPTVPAIPDEGVAVTPPVVVAESSDLTPPATTDIATPPPLAVANLPETPPSVEETVAANPPVEIVSETSAAEAAPPQIADDLSDLMALAGNLSQLPMPSNEASQFEEISA